MTFNEYSLRALVLAAGYGSRLRPLTDYKPKCLMELNGVPILEDWLCKLEKIGCEKALVNTHYLAHQVRGYLDKRKVSNMQVIESYEKSLLGTAGTLKNLSEYFKESRTLLIHADNATTANINELLIAHDTRPEGCLLTMMTFTTDTPESCGIVQTDQTGRVIEFHEKSTNPPGNQANAAIYVFDPPFLELLESTNAEANDFSTGILPLLMGKIHTYHTEEFFLDIGTPANLARTQAIWAGLETEIG